MYKFYLCAGKQRRSVNHIPEVSKRKLWAGDKVVLPAGSARQVKVWIEGGWKGVGFVESIPPEEKEAGRKLVQNEYNLMGSAQAIYIENHTEEKVKLCIRQRLDIMHS